MPCHRPSAGGDVNAALTGGTVKPTIQTGFTIITKDNLSAEGGDAAYKSSC